MRFPESGDVLIRDVAAGYIVVDAVNWRQLSGPYPSIGDAFAAARGRIAAGHVWRENLDRRGRTLGQPFLLELPASTLA